MLIKLIISTYKTEQLHVKSRASQFALSIELCIKAEATPYTICISSIRFAIRYKSLTESTKILVGHWNPTSLLKFTTNISSCGVKLPRKSFSSMQI